MGKGLLKTLFTGRSLIRLETTVSTNIYANELLANSEPSEGTAIMAEYQQHGKGQRGTNWISEFGSNLLVTFIFYPRFVKPQEQFGLSVFSSLAVADTIASFGAKNVSVKWPNDVYIGDSKVAGILIENNIRGNQVLSSLIGIGINVNQQEFPVFTVKATSLYVATGNLSDKSEVYESLSNNLEKYYLKLKKGEFKKLKNKYEEKLFKKDEFHNYESDGKIFSGKITGVDDEGLLNIIDEQNNKLAFDFKEIKFAV